MNHSSQALTGREKYIVALMYIIGGMFLILQVVSILSSKSTIFNSADGMVSINRNELLSFLRVLTTIILSFAGAILFTKRKAAGWSINLAVLIFFTILLGSMLYTNYHTPDLGMGIGGFVMLLLIVAILFLLFRNTRVKYKVNRSSVIGAVSLLLFLLGFYIYLQ